MVATLSILILNLSLSPPLHYFLYHPTIHESMGPTFMSVITGCQV